MILILLTMNMMMELRLNLNIMFQLYLWFWLMEWLELELVFSIPKFNPLDVVENIENKLKGKEYQEMKPWYKNFKGEIIKINDTDCSFQKESMKY